MQPGGYGALGGHPVAPLHFSTVGRPDLSTFSNITGTTTAGSSPGGVLVSPLAGGGGVGLSGPPGPPPGGAYGGGFPAGFSGASAYGRPLGPSATDGGDAAAVAARVDDGGGRACSLDGGGGAAAAAADEVPTRGCTDGGATATACAGGRGFAGRDASPPATAAGPPAPPRGASRLSARDGTPPPRTLGCFTNAGDSDACARFCHTTHR